MSKIIKRHYGAIYIPDKFGALAQQVAKRFAEIAGGSTTEHVQGNWIMQDGQLCAEPIIKVGVWYAGIEESQKVLEVRNAVIRVLFLAGEEGVATEGSSPDKGSALVIYTEENQL